MSAMPSNSDPRTPAERRLTWLFRATLLLLLCVAAWQCRDGWPVSSSLLDLVPQAAGDAVQQRAQDRIQEPLARQMVALVGAKDREHAAELARGMGYLWQRSGLFAKVQVDVDVDLAAMRAQLLAQRLSMLPPADRAQLINDPAAFAARRAREVADPFSSTGIVPAGQDLLGLARRAEQALQPGGAVQFDLASGTLVAEQGGMNWVLVRAETSGDAFDQAAPAAVAALVGESRASLAASGGELLVAGGPLYAAAGRAQAVGESAWIGGGAVAGIIAVLLLALRRWRALLAFIPAAVGLLAGTVACVAMFGSIHVLTLVVGASLIGIAVDFPMHFLGKSYGMPDWRPWPALDRVLPGLSISLAATLVGYLALVFTPFPALTQTAVFSAAGLLGAYLCTVCELPNWYRGWQPRPWPALLHTAQALLERLSLWSARGRLPWVAVLALVLCVGGIARLNVQDDLRQWLSLPRPLLQQARRIGEITGFMPTSQFYLVRAANPDALLRTQAELATRLDALVAGHTLVSYTALSQLNAPAQAQEALRQRLRDPDWRARLAAPFEALGIPATALQAEVDALAALPPVGVEQALQGPLGERWRPLWLGTHDGTVAAMVTLQGLNDTAAAAHAAAGLPGTAFIDRTGELNRNFAATRVKAAELKLLSYIVAAVLLWSTLGRSATWRVLAVPFGAAACVLAALGYLGQPLTLFSLFGLLLVSAIGLDYAVFMHERVAGAAASLVGILLAAAITLLSFGLLALSSTPAIANFGLAVGLGVAFSVLWAPWVRPRVFSTER
jgi:predicted exporter